MMVGSLVGSWMISPVKLEKISCLFRRPKLGLYGTKYGFLSGFVNFPKAVSSIDSGAQSSRASLMFNLKKGSKYMPLTFGTNKQWQIMYLYFDIQIMMVNLRIYCLNFLLFLISYLSNSFIKILLSAAKLTGFRIWVWSLRTALPVLFKSSKS